jgi:formate--tetrahydrofolate ligase
VAILRKFHLPTVVALNRFSSDSDEDIRSIQHFCAELGVESAVAEVFNGGGEGALELAGKVVEAAAKANLDRIKPLYVPNSPIEDKISLIAREIYGASSVHFEPEAKRKIETFSALGFAQLPVCMAKTQYSLSDDPKKVGRAHRLDPDHNRCRYRRRRRLYCCRRRQYDAHAGSAKNSSSRADETE